MGIPKGFPKSVGRVGSRLHGFPCFPYSVISMACFSRGKCWINRYAATQCNVPHSPRDALRYSSLVNECIGDIALIDRLCDRGHNVLSEAFMFYSVLPYFRLKVAPSRIPLVAPSKTKVELGR